MGRRHIAIFLFISLALSVIPTIQNYDTEPIFATAQSVDSELSTEQKRLVNQTALRIINANPSSVGNGTIITQSPAALMMVPALAQVIERIVVQASNSDRMITHLAIETAANPTGPISQGLLLFAQRLAVGDTTGISQLASLIAQLTESSTAAANVTTQEEDITGNISQLIVQQAFQSALGANQLLNQVANKLATNSSKLSVNNVTISSDAIAQAIQQIIIQVSLQPQGVLSFQPLLFIANQVNQNPLGPISKSIVRLAQLQSTGGVGASQSIAQSISELVKQILDSAAGNITESTGTIPTTELTSEEQSEDQRTKIIIRDEFDEREPPIFQPRLPPSLEDEAPIFQENFSELQPSIPPALLEDNLTELQPPVTNDTSTITNRTETGDTTRPPPIIRNFTSPLQPPEEEPVAPPEPPTPTDTNETAQIRVITEVINDNGGNKTAEDFKIHIFNADGTRVAGPVPAAPAPEGTVFDLAPGVYIVGSSSLPLRNYDTTFEGDCTTFVAVIENQTKNCTIINDDIAVAQLTVSKEVINDNGGTQVADDFSFGLVNSRDDSVYPLSLVTPTQNERTFDLAVGTYYLKTGGFDYLAIFEGDCDSKGKVTIVADGTNKSCTVKFDDRVIGAVKFVTDVINDNGGNKTARDFQFDLIRAGGLLVTIRGAPPPDGETWTTPSDYSIIPHTVPDYATTLEGDCTDVLVVENVTKTCTIINNDLPVEEDGGVLSPPPPPSSSVTGNQTAQLKVISQVVNDNGGNKTASDFQVGLLDGSSGMQVIPPHPGAPAPDGITFSMPPGGYQVSVDQRLYDRDAILPLEYSVTFEGHCDSKGFVKLAEFEEPECVVKHDDGAGELIASTSLVNDEGGNASFTDFKLHVTSPTGSDLASLQLGDNYLLLSPGTYTVNQEPVIGYNTTFEGSCDTSGKVVISAGTIGQCTIQSDDGLNQTSAKLVVNTHVVNNYGLPVQPQDLGATVDIFGREENNIRGIVVAQFLASDGRTAFLVPPGRYAINFSPGPSITNFLGNFSFANTCPEPQVLNAGDTKACSVIFRQIAQPANGTQPVSTGTLNVRTHIINDDTNSTLEASDVFILLKVGQVQQLFKGSEGRITFTLPADTQYFVAVAESPSTHLISHTGDCGGLTGLGGNTTILPDEIKTCTITLDDSGSNIQTFSLGNNTLVNLTGPSSATVQKETICDDGIDNDNDVKLDAADEDCFFASSSRTTEENATTTSLTPPTEPVQAPTQTQEQQQKQAEENNPPTADAGDDFSTESGNTVKLNGEASSDPDAGQTLSYLWEQVSPDSPSVSLNGEKGEVASFKVPNMDEDTKFRFELTVKDGNGGEDTDSVTVAILGSADEEEVKEEEEQEQQEEQQQEQEQKEVESSDSKELT